MMQWPVCYHAAGLLTHQGSNLDSSDPESDVLPITPWVKGEGKFRNLLRTKKEHCQNNRIRPALYLPTVILSCRNKNLNRTHIKSKSSKMSGITAPRRRTLILIYRLLEEELDLYLKLRKSIRIRIKITDQTIRGRHI